MSHRPLLLLTVVALAALVAPRAGAEEPDEVLDLATTTTVSARIHEIYARFDHRTHEKVFEDYGVGCLGCHQLGGRTADDLPDETLDSAYLTPPPAACHFCHNPSDDREPMGPRTCYSCHGEVPPPDSHGADWREWHGTDARMGSKPCELCHKRSYCVDCHVKRDPLNYAVHDRSWLAVHGIAAFADPSECSTCHLQADCVKCHATSDGRLP